MFACRQHRDQSHRIYIMKNVSFELTDLGPSPARIVRKVSGIEVVLCISESSQHLHVRLHILDHVDITLLLVGYTEKEGLHPRDVGARESQTCRCWVEYGHANVGCCTQTQLEKKCRKGAQKYDRLECKQAPYMVHISASNSKKKNLVFWFGHFQRRPNQTNIPNDLVGAWPCLDVRGTIEPLAMRWN